MGSWRGGKYGYRCFALLLIVVVSHHGAGFGMWRLSTQLLTFCSQAPLPALWSHILSSYCGLTCCTGQIFCSRCCRQRCAFPHLGFHEPVRACLDCYPKQQANLPRPRNSSLSASTTNAGLWVYHKSSYKNKVETPTNLLFVTLTLLSTLLL